jgi:hypothetical protein
MARSERIHVDETDEGFFHAYKKEMRSDQWESFKGAKSANMLLVLNHTKNMLMQYKPLFSAHPKGVQKIGIIRQLIALIEGISDGVKADALLNAVSKIHWHIDYLLTGHGQRDSIRLFPGSAALSGGNSRSVSGYITTLKLSHHLLSTVIGRKSFLKADLDRSIESHEYFKERSTADTQVREMLSTTARSTIRDRLRHIEKEVRRQWGRNECLSEKAEWVGDIAPLSLTAQLSMTGQLMLKIGRSDTWGEDQMKQLLSLKYHYYERENSGLKTINVIRVVNGEFSYDYKAPDSGIVATTGSDGGIEMVPLAKENLSKKLSLETSVRKVSALLRRPPKEDGIMFAEAVRDIKEETPPPRCFTA